MQTADRSASARTRALKGRTVAATHTRDSALTPSPYADRSAAAQVVDYAIGVSQVPCCGGEPVLPPTAPMITGVQEGNGSLTVNFTAPRAAIPDVLYYTVRATFINTRAATVIDVSGTSSPITVSGLTNGSVYSVQVAATTAAGTSVWSPEDAVGSPYTSPGAPASLSVSAGNGSLTLTITPGSDGGRDISGYEYSTDGTTWLVLNVSGGVGTITELTNGRAYTVRVRAANARGSGAAATVVGTPVLVTLPGAPTLVRTLADDGKVYLYFNAGTTGGGTITNYEFSTDGGTTFTAFNPPQASNPVQIAELTTGQSYSLALKAINSAGVGTASGTLSEIPVAPSTASASLWLDPTDTSTYVRNASSITSATTKGSAPSLTSTSSNASITYDASAGGCFNFTGTNGVRFQFPAYDFGNTITTSAWIYPRYKANINGLLTNVGANVAPAGFKFQWNWWQNDSRVIGMQAGNGTAGNDDYSPPGTIIYEQWQHIAYEFDKVNRTVIFFRNGEPVAIATDGIPVENIKTTGTFSVGGYNDGSYTINAKLGELKVYTTLLDATQIRAEYNAGKMRFGLA